MKRKVLTILTCLLCFGCLFLQYGCEGKAKLSTPTNVKIVDEVLQWDQVEDADGYVVYVDGKEYTTQENSLDLFTLTTATKTVDVKVKATKDIGGKNSSKWSAPVQYYISSFPFTLQPINDGKEYRITGIEEKAYGKIVIPKTAHDGKPITEIGSFAFSQQSEITAVIISETVKYIDDNAFYNCAKLSRILLPEGLEVIEFNTFANCTFKEITLPQSVKEIKRSAFSYCASLKKINLPENLTYIREQAFYNCSSLEELKLPKTIMDIENRAFYGCINLKTIQAEEGLYYKSQSNCLIKKFDYSVQLGCSESVIPSIAKSIGSSAFAGNDNLKKIQIPGNIEKISTNAFGNSGLEKIEIPDSVKEIGVSAFEKCTNLSQVTLPQGLKVLPKNCFQQCTKLEQIVIPKEVEEIQSYAFNKCINLTFIALSDSLKVIGEYAFNNCSKLQEVAFPEGLEVIEENAFASCKSLTEITFPESLKEVKSKAFTNCIKLKTVEFKEGIESLGSVAEKAEDNVSPFHGCAELQSLHIPSTVKLLSNSIASECSSLAQLTVAEENPYFKSVENCIIKKEDDSLVSICLNGKLTEEVQIIGERSYYGIDVTEVILPNGITKIENQAFYYCSSLTKVVLPETLTSLGVESFAYCNLLDDVKIPAGITEIPNSAFYKCKSLKTLSLPEGIVSLGSYAFYACAFRTFKLPSTVKYLYDGCFSENAFLQAISLNEGLLAIGKGALAGNFDSITLPSTVEFMDSGNVREKTVYTTKKSNNSVITPLIELQYVNYTPMPAAVLTGCTFGEDENGNYVKSYMYLPYGDHGERSFYRAEAKSFSAHRQVEHYVQIPTRIGYEFKGWAEQEGGKVLYPISNKSSYSNFNLPYYHAITEEDEDVIRPGTVLYAVWEKAS